MNTPTIFYSPHQDDEAIGFAGGIMEHKEAGRDVYLVLLTNGVNPDLLDIMNGKKECPIRCSYCDGNNTHNFNLTMEQLIWARNVDFIASAQALGVTRTYIIEKGRGLNDDEFYSNDTASYDKYVDKIASIISGFETAFPGSSHKLVSGLHDIYPGSQTPNPTHKACWDAALKLKDKISDFRFYRVYQYEYPYTDVEGQIHELPQPYYTYTLKPSWMKAKMAALEQYNIMQPSAGRYATGYHSVPDLFKKAKEIDKEFIDLLP